ncbi:MAG: alpha-L-rhamnosidase [Clostridia bacterium]|nr:alpha-L-rhamnosidase [Clostridia bacterium]
MKKIGDINPSLAGYAADPRVRRYLSPVRIVKIFGDASGAENLIGEKACQITLGGGEDVCTLSNVTGCSENAGVLLDYGTEISGTARIMVFGVNSGTGRADLHIRFGESVSEALSDLGEKNSCCDHANRDDMINVGFLSANETNETGFRFIYLELTGEDVSVSLKAVQAVFIFQDLEYRGSFECSDPLVNKIWQTAAYTAHLNMQEYLWDGIKRDRLVWIGDMQTEVMTIASVFGYNDIVPRSMDLVRDETPVGEWMNGISSYSLWWIFLQYDFYMSYGDYAYLLQQREYMTGLLSLLCGYVGDDGAEKLPESRFIDWPNSENEEAKHAGLQSMLLMAMERGAFICDTLGEYEISDKCRKAAEKLSGHRPSAGGSKQAASLMVCAGLADAEKTNREILSVGGAKGFSTFLGYYTLSAIAESGDYDGAIEAMKQYWGGMLDMGATTFWEDFNIDWMENSGRIDEPVPDGKRDIHGDFGAYCYLGFRHSLCHGWASGPVPYLAQTVLGVKVTSPGTRSVDIVPHLGRLDYVKGSYPTPHGDIRISHVRGSGGIIDTKVELPPMWRKTGAVSYEYFG